MTPTTSGENELLPCPFCGGEGAYQTDTEEEEFSEEWIGCLECCATTALEVWNRRSAGLGTVSVKPLEWVKSGPNNWSASTPFGDYHIERDGIPARDVGLYFPLTLKVGFISENISTYNSTSAVAKASAEAHHQARVKSCLTSIGVEAGK